MTASAKPLPALKNRLLSPTQKKLPNFRLGDSGEARAITFLQTHHFTIIDQNVVWQSCEVDIIAHDVVHDELVFVEVKTRSSDAAGDPSAAVGRKKLLAMQRVARGYLQRHPWEKGFRFDIITVLPGKIEHFENVTM